MSDNKRPSEAAVSTRRIQTEEEERENDGRKVMLFDLRRGKKKDSIDDLNTNSSHRCVQPIVLLKHRSRHHHTPPLPPQHTSSLLHSTQFSHLRSSLAGIIPQTCHLQLFPIPTFFNNLSQRYPIGKLISPRR